MQWKMFHALPYVASRPPWIGWYWKSIWLRAPTVCYAFTIHLKAHVHTKLQLNFSWCGLKMSFKGLCKFMVKALGHSAFRVAHIIQHWSTIIILQYMGGNWRGRSNYHYFSLTTNIFIPIAWMWSKLRPLNNFSFMQSPKQGLQLI